MACRADGGGHCRAEEAAQNAAHVDAAGLPDGFHDLIFTLHGRGEAEVQRQPFLALTGRREDFAAGGPAALQIRLHQVSAENLVLVNGSEVGHMPADAKEGQVLKLELAPEGLRRLNAVEVVSAKATDSDKWDDFWVDGVDMRYEGKTYADYRYSKYAGNWVFSKADAPGRFTFYVDLTRAE